VKPEELKHKQINPHEISIHFINEPIIAENQIINFQEEKGSISEIKSLEKQFPQPKFAKPLDYRPSLKNTSFYY